MTELLPPHLLYKYLSPKMTDLDRLEHIRQILVDDTIYYPRPDQLNDGDDCRPIVLEPTGSDLAKRLTRAANTRVAHGSESKRHAGLRTKQGWLVDQKRLRANWNRGLDDWGTYSLAGSPTNLHLWTEYADELQGVCIAFDWQTALDDFELLPLKITYQEHRAKFAAEDLYEPQLHSWNVSKMLFTKTLRYAREDEYRFLLDIKANGGQKKRVPSECITGLIFGENVRDSDRGQIMEWVNRRPIPIGVQTAYEGSSEILIR